MTLLTRELSIFQTLKQRLASLEELSEDDPVILDTAAGECKIEEILAGLIREARYAEALAEGMKTHLAETKSRYDRLVRKADHLRAIAHWGLCEAGLQKIAAPDFTVTRSQGRPSVVLTEKDSQKIPDDFVRITREPNKSAIRDALLSGKALPFAFMSNPEEILTVRAK